MMIEWLMWGFNAVMAVVIVVCLWSALWLYREANRRKDSLLYITATVVALFAAFEIVMYADFLRIVYLSEGFIG